MKQCWPEGDLRAYVDGELPGETLQRIANHLKTCDQCASRHRELSGRAARVSSLMEILPVVTTPVLPVHIVPVRKNRPARWTIAVAALAAGLVIGFVAMPRETHETRQASVAEAVSTPAAVGLPAPLTQATLPAAVQRPPARRRVVRQAAVRPTIAHADFLRLDDEPLETGTVVRVSVRDGDVQADLIVGPDGRAHAIRLVSSR